ncbi:MAG: M23 family metallopeptidase [Clostridia bacterium]|nr:M23 family metallopeptidase [Clostridia bacterium]
MKLNLPYRSGTVRVSSAYGTRTLNGVPELHKGVDLVGSDKTIVAPCDGWIGLAGFANDAASGGKTHEWGNYIRIETEEGYKIYLCHLESVSVRERQKVKAGDVLGREGSTGKSTGNHCHFEIRKDGKSTDPTPFLGIANRIGSYPVTVQTSTGKNTDYAGLVCEKAGLEAQTKAYLDKYKYASDLWRKLWEAMQ